MDYNGVNVATWYSENREDGMHSWRINGQGNHWSILPEKDMRIVIERIIINYKGIKLDSISTLEEIVVPCLLRERSGDVAVHVRENPQEHNIEMFSYNPWAILEVVDKIGLPSGKLQGLLNLHCPIHRVAL